MTGSSLLLLTECRMQGGDPTAGHFAADGVMGSRTATSGTGGAAKGQSQTGGQVQKKSRSGQAAL
ncbi:hypothetical protein [Gabonibacter chumensis]|uniref:hypothetical protein n=1 Tax=Gabonibacter chumensis TaxID=2972474 RepID=UPI0025747109|nr:hypothetical protein [Gabonibacter chumensis]MCR9010751.1 hypothetical protein [Gabonibacter chumensis]